MNGKLVYFILISLLILTASEIRAQDDYGVVPIASFDRNWHAGVMDVAVDGEYAYLACTLEGLRILRDYDGEAIGELSQVECNNGIIEIALHGTTVYGGWYNEWYVFDVSTPAAPVLAETVEFSGTITEMRVIGGRLYVCGEGAGWKIYDLTIPTHPELLWESPSMQVYDLDVQNGRIYVIGGMVWIYDFGFPTSPILLNTFRIWGQGIRVNGQFGYLACGEEGFEVIDLNNGAVLAANSSLTYAYDLQLRDNLVYLHYGPFECPLALIDVTMPDNPTVLSIYSPPVDMPAFALEGNRAYIADNWHGFRTVDISDPSNAHEIARFNPIGNYRRVQSENGRLYVWSESKVQMFDAAEAAHPVELGYIETPNELVDFKVSGTLGFSVQSHAEVLTAWDLSNPVQPVRLFGWAPPEWDCPMALAVDGTHVFAFRSGNISVFDFSDRDNIHHVTDVETRGYARDVQTINHYAVGLDRQMAVVFDLTEPLNPHLIRETVLDSYGYDLQVADGFVYVLTANDLRIFATDRLPSLLALQSITAIDGDDANGRVSLAVSGQQVFVTNDLHGLLVYDASDRVHPQLGGRQSLPNGVTDVTAMGQMAIVTNSASMLFYDCSGAMANGENADAGLPGSIALLPNYPNPFNATTQVQFELPNAQQVSLTVYDLLGRRVAELANAVYPAGTHRVAWDATNAASGQYFVRLQSGAVVQTQRMMLVK